MLMMTGLDGWHGGVNEIARIKLDYLSQLEIPVEYSNIRIFE